jgi:hypothetical protein
MKKLLAFTLLPLFFLSSTPSPAPSDAFTEKAQSFFRTYVKEGKVDYAGVKAKFVAIEALRDQIGRMNLAQASDNSREAFYINAYNLLVIYEVARRYPLKSVMDVSGFFDETKHQLAGEEMTLNALEKDKLIKPYGDARVHFALACAAKGCPQLADYAYLPEKLDVQLGERTRIALNYPYFIRVNDKQKKAEVSKIFQWYEKDFTAKHSSVLAFINSYRQKKISASYALDYYEYDWSLNGK